MPTDALRADSLTGLRVFVSYPRGGLAQTWAEQLQADLERRSASVFRDTTGIAPGDADWLARIEQALQRADVLVAVFGPDSADSRWQMRELLQADDLGLAVVACTVADARLPLYAKERQPVPLRDGVSQAASLAAVARAVQALAPRPALATPAQAAGVPPEQRATETAWLGTLLARRLARHEAVYEPLAAQGRPAGFGDRLHQVLRVDAGVLLAAFGPGAKGRAQAAADDAPPVPYPDVLDAYRSLPQRRVPRLVVLGEPGAGKSFSLERLACDHARRALHDPAAPLPLLLRLGLWTRADEPLDAFAQRQLDLDDDNQPTGLGRWWPALRDQRRAVLLLDGLNEIPPDQRADKATQVRRLADDSRWVAVVISCRQRDYEADFQLPFDRLTLQPLTPLQVHRCLLRCHAEAEPGPAGAQRAEQRFWQIAGAGPALRDTWHTWQAAGASFEQFWTALDVPREAPNVHSQTSAEQDRLWRAARHGPRSLLRLAANPYLLSVMMVLDDLPASRARLFDGFLQVLHHRESQARAARGDAASVPDLAGWLALLTRLAENLQHLGPVDGEAGAGGAATSLPRSHWPAGMADALDFSRDASVLQLAGDDLRFSHQLLQEALASRALLQACEAGQDAATFWPPQRWWQRRGWEVVAEIAVESLAGDPPAAQRLLAWLARANPGVALDAWLQAGQPALPPSLLQATAAQWRPRLTDAVAEPSPLARAAIGRWLGRLGLDQRPGVGLRADGLPDIDWVRIATPGEWVYQGGRQPPLPAFDIARYPVTHRQFQAFIDAGGYAQPRWWAGLAQRFDTAADAQWAEPNAPRERVSWYEAVAYCRWLGAALGADIRLPTEQQWERAARGMDGREYPWGQGYAAGNANCDEVGYDKPAGGVNLSRTTAVGVYPLTTPEGIFDMAGNVWEWCLNEHENPENVEVNGEASRVLRGASWMYVRQDLRAADRFDNPPDTRNLDFGFRVCRVAPIDKPTAGALDAEPLTPALRAQVADGQAARPAGGQQVIAGKVAGIGSVLLRPFAAGQDAAHQRHQIGLGHLAQRVVHHPIAADGGADAASLGLVDVEVAVGLRPPGAAAQLVAQRQPPWGYPAALGLIGVSCGLMYWRFRRLGCL